MGGTMKKTLAALSVLGLGIALLGCGSSDGGDTTVIRKRAPAPEAQTVTTTTTSTTKAKAPPPETTTTETAQGTPPDVVGLTLPEAKKQLSAAGYKADVSNTDTTFGILVPQNYTVCTQDDPRGDVVPILAQKYGC
jgi:hypothetical protein